MVEPGAMAKRRVGRCDQRTTAREHAIALSTLSRCADWNAVRGRRVRLMYVEFHARSAFTFLEGGSIPEELVDVCAKLGMKAMALLDRDGVYGSARFHLAAKKLGLTAHVGAEISYSPQRHRDTEKNG